MKLKNFFYFLTYLCCFLLLAGTVVFSVYGILGVNELERYTAIYLDYILPYGAFAISALFGIVYLFGKNPLKMLLFFVHIILCVAVALSLFLPDIWVKFLHIFM